MYDFDGNFRALDFHIKTKHRGSNCGKLGKVFKVFKIVRRTKFMKHKEGHFEEQEKLSQGENLQMRL